jgi:hypothetical protein
MPALDAFYEAYTWFSICQRVFEDVCRCLVDAPSDPAERKALVDESLEYAMEVGDAVADAQDALPDAVEEAAGDRAMLEMLSKAAEILKADGTRASQYVNAVAALRLGAPARALRRPKPVSPFRGLSPSEGDAEGDPDDGDGDGDEDAVDPGEKPEVGSAGDSEDDEDGDEDDGKDEDADSDGDSGVDPRDGREYEDDGWEDEDGGEDSEGLPSPPPRRTARPEPAYRRPAPRQENRWEEDYEDDGEEEEPPERMPRAGRSPLIAESEAILGESPEPPERRPGRGRERVYGSFEEGHHLSRPKRTMKGMIRR